MPTAAIDKNLRDRLKAARQALKASTSEASKILACARLWVAYADSESLFGRNVKAAKQLALANDGQEIQNLVEPILLTSPQDHDPAKGDVLEATYLKMRGIDIEAAGKQTGLLGIKTLLADRLPEKHKALAEKLSSLDPAKYPSLLAAHAVKVQTLVSWGRFYTVAPWPLKHLDQAIELLQRALEESLSNPGQLPIAIEPVAAHLFLCEALQARSNNGDRALAEKHRTRAAELLQAGLSRWENETGPALNRLLETLDKTNASAK